MNNIDNYVSIAEYAKIWDMSADTIKKRCQRGSFYTARKIGRNWILDKTEKPIDHRKKIEIQN